MLNSKPLSQHLFLDIETVPQYRSFYDMSTSLQELFLKRFKKDAEEMLGVLMDDWKLEDFKTEELKPKLEKFYANRAALHPEFAKIVCISIGRFKSEKNTSQIPENLSVLDPNTELSFTVGSYKDKDEKVLLKLFYEEWKAVLSKSLNHQYHLVGFNCKNFDFPMIAKRMLINYLPLPAFFDIADLKPWQIEHWQDLKEVYKFSVYDANASLALLCEVFGIETPKSDIQGKDVRDVYYNTGDVDRIAKYCEADVKATTELYLRMKGLRNKVIVV